MKTIFKYLKYEILDRLFSSKKKIIKFIAICLVPFLYGFICIWAFWNPVPNIGNVPMAIVDNSSRINFAIGFNNDSGKKKIIMGEVYDLDSTNKPISIKNPDAPTTSITLSECLVYIPNFSFVESFITGWNDIKFSNSLISENDNGTYTIRLSETSPLKNVSYFNDQTKTKSNEIAEYDKNMINPITNSVGAWSVKNEDYWLQIQIPSDFNQVLSNLLTKLYNISNLQTPPTLGESFQIISSSLEPLKDEPINVWTTFKKNFLFGQFMKVFNEFKSSLYIDFFPELISQTLVKIIYDIFNNMDNSFRNSILYSPSADINVTLSNVQYHVGSKGEANSVFNGDINLKANEKYLFRNDEILNALKASSISSNEQNKLNSVATYEGNTTTLNATSNDWTISSQNTSFVDLTVMLTKPILEALLPSSNYASSTIPTNVISKYLTNKMFITSLYESDKNVFPKKAIVSIFVDGVVSGLINNLTSTDPLFSNNSQFQTTNKAFVTENEFNAYMDNFRATVAQIIQAIMKGNPVLAAAPPSVIADTQSGLNGIITSGVVGEQYSAYGIGLGQFFLFIGIWVGILMQTFMLDRKRRGESKDSKKFFSNKKITLWTRISESTTWFFSKYLMMSFITFIQVTILSCTVAAIGWGQIGPSFGLVYLQLLFSGFVFTLFIQSLWFLFRDEVIGKFIVILFLIINLSSGWGTFPPQMQSPFFMVLSYIAPFTYQIKNIGAIVYGISVVGSNSMDNLFILSNIGISFIYVAVALILATFGSLKLTKMQYYGTFNDKKLIDILNNNSYLLTNLSLNINDVIILNKKNKQRINWNLLPQEYCSELANVFNETYPYETKFKWYMKKNANWKQRELEDAKL